MVWMLLFQLFLIAGCHILHVHGRPSTEGVLTRESRASVCVSKPEHQAAFGQWALKPNDTHKLSIMAPTLHHHSFRTINEDDLQENGLLAGSTDCPATPIFAPDEPIMGRSLCPWYWKVNYNAARIPAMLPEAVCRCRRAVTGINGVVVYECQPLTMHIRVLQLDAKCDKYEERSIEMAVACVSVVQSSMRLNKIAGIEQTGHPRLTQDI